MPLFGADDSDVESVESFQDDSVPEPSFAYKPSSLAKKSVAVRDLSSSSTETDVDEADIDEAPPVSMLEEEDDASDVSSKQSSPSIELPIEMPPAVPSPYARKSLAELSRQDPSRNRVMQASIFPTKRAFVSKAKQLQIPLKNASHNRKETVTDKMNVDETAPRKQMPRMPPSLPRKHRKLTKAPLRESILSQSHGMARDSSLALSGSFRAGWSSDGRLATVYDSKGKSTGPAKVQLCQPALVATTSQIAKEAAQSLLDIQRKHTRIDLEDDIPYCQPSPDFRFHHLKTAFTATDLSFESNLFRLASALFDEIPQLHDVHDYNLSSSQISHLTKVARQALISEWLEQVTSPKTEEEIRLNNDAAAQIFSYLSSHQLEEACKCAIANHDFRLATLISQASHPDFSFQSDLKLQLSKWREQTVDSQISLTYRKIYELLAGNVELSPASEVRDAVDGCKAVYVPDGLDWKRVFGLFFWYGESSDLSAAVSAYDTACSSKSQRPSLPLPWYSDSSHLKKWSLSSSAKANDVQYELLRFVASPSSSSLETLLNPTGFSPSPLDVRLSWHLYILLAKVLRVADFEDRINLENGDSTSSKAEQLTCDYANQLERLGLWEWACFVLLHLSFPESREKAIKQVLVNNMASITDQKADLLSQDFLIPFTWLDEAQALHARFYNDSWSESRLLMSAGLFSQAHRVIAFELAPEAVVRNDFELLEKLFVELQDVQLQVADWQNGGQIYLDYVACVVQLPELLKSGDGDAFELERLSRQVLPNLLARLPTFLQDKSVEGRDLIKKAAVSEMLAQVSRIKVAFSSVNDAVDEETPIEALSKSDRLNWLQGLTSNMLAESLQVS